MLVISAREFRNNLKSYLEKIDNGMEILIQRSKKTYKIVPVSENDTVMSKEEFVEKINLSLQQIKDGKYTSLNTEEDIKNLFASI